jgi:hypothetical protein
MNRFFAQKAKGGNALQFGINSNTGIELAYAAGSGAATNTEHGATYVLMTRLTTEAAIIQAAETLKREIEVARDQALALLKS